MFHLVATETLRLIHAPGEVPVWFKITNLMEGSNVSHASSPTTKISQPDVRTLLSHQVPFVMLIMSVRTRVVVRISIQPLVCGGNLLDYQSITSVKLRVVEDLVACELKELQQPLTSSCI